ncbi:MAG: hypothetical protein PF481_11030 [Bacteroidales bacterium]|jgi:hypothetical protein|nr:hypothetical protein [Bacteroidales bacterium]
MKNKGLLTLFGIIFWSVSICQTVTITGNIQTNVIGDQSGIDVSINNTTTSTTGNTIIEPHNTTTNSEGFYSISFDLHENSTGIPNPYWPANLEITFSKYGFENHIINNYIIQDEGNMFMDNIILFPPDVTVYEPSICMIRVDTTTNLNNVVWERETENNIKEYIIYKLQEEWFAIDTLPFDSLSVYEDFETANSPNTSYQIQAIFNDDTKSAYSTSAEPPTIELSLINGSPQIKWGNTKDIEMFQSGKIEKIIMFRSKTRDNFVRYDSISISDINLSNPTFSTQDRSIEEDGIYFYRIGYLMTSACWPTVLKANSGPFSLAMSNIAESEYVEVDETDIETAENNITIEVFDHSLTISNNKGVDIDYTIYSLTGQLVSQGTCQQQCTVNLSPGTYSIVADTFNQTILIQ